MDGGYLLDPLGFVIETLLRLYLLVLMLRFLLQWSRADFYNPFSQLLMRAAKPALQPFRRIVPSTSRVDGPSLVAMLIIQCLALGVLFSIKGVLPGLGTLLLLAVAQLVELAIDVFFFSILIAAVLSWIGPGSRHPMTGILDSLNRPLLTPARRLLPPTGGIDLSPLVVLLGLQVAKMLLVRPLTDLASRMM